MAERERGALILAPLAGVVWGTVMAIAAWRFEGAEVVLLQGFIFGPAWLLGWLGGRPLTGAAAGLLYVGTAIWIYEFLPGWGFEHRLPTGLSPADRQTVIDSFDAADIVLLTTHLVGALCGLGGALWAGREDADADAEPVGALEPRPLPPLLARPVEPLWGEPELQPEPAPETPNVAEHPPEPGTQRRSAPSRRRIAAAALAVTALGTDAALGLLFFTYSDAQETGAWLFAAGAAAAAAVLGRRYALAALVAGVILACGAAAIQDAEYSDRETNVSVTPFRP